MIPVPPFSITFVNQRKFEDKNNSHELLYLWIVWLQKHNVVQAKMQMWISEVEKKKQFTLIITWSEYV